MVDFFTSPKDLEEWIQLQPSPDNAAHMIIDMVNTVSTEDHGIVENHEQDINDTCKAIYNKHDENASKVLFGILASHKLATIKTASGVSLKKEAQIMRQPGEYPMPLRVCPKLPFSVGKRLISTYNCRHYCLDSIVFDDDPERVYCAEALWRRHVMDKFSREFKDKNGRWVGGYLNDRFHVLPDAGTPANPNVPRDGGNQMELAHGQRTREPRPHQYSIERRLSEARGEETYDITPSASVSNKTIRTAETGNRDDEVAEMFSDMIDMKEAGWSDEDIVYHVADHYTVNIPFVTNVFRFAMKQSQRHSGTMYTYAASIKSNSLLKTAQAYVAPSGTTMVATQNVNVLSNGQQTNIQPGTPVVLVSEKIGESPEFEIVDGADAGRRFTLTNVSDARSAFAPLDSPETNIQDAAEELGLNDGNIENEENKIADIPSNTSNPETFPIQEI